jgi:Holliday junction resolvase RusA-like endonuclease
MRVGFVLDVTGFSVTQIRDAVESEAENIKNHVNYVENPEEHLFKVKVTSYQKKDRWKGDVPREDIGKDLDNVLKPIFDGLGPIIGYRKKYGKVDEGYAVVGTAGSADSKIVEVSAKKINSGTTNEYLSIEIEEIN